MYCGFFKPRVAGIPSVASVGRIRRLGGLKHFSGDFEPDIDCPVAGFCAACERGAGYIGVGDAPDVKPWAHGPYGEF